VAPQTRAIEALGWQHADCFWHERTLPDRQTIPMAMLARLLEAIGQAFQYYPLHREMSEAAAFSFA